MRRGIPGRAAALWAVVPLAGCLVTGTLDASGGARLTLKWRLLSATQFDVSERMMGSSEVRLVASTIDLEKWATFEFEVDDVRQLPTASVFAMTQVSLASPDEQTRALAVAITNPRPVAMMPETIAYNGREATVRLTLPGEVTGSNATVTEGRTLAWTWPMGEASLSPGARLEATYVLPGG